MQILRQFLVLWLQVLMSLGQIAGGIAILASHVLLMPLVMLFWSNGHSDRALLGSWIKSWLKDSSKWLEQRIQALEVTRTKRCFKRKKLPPMRRTCSGMKPPWRKLCKSKFIMPIILLSCATAWPAESLKDKARFLHHFDSDSIPIRFDCHASRSMGFAADQFVGPVTPMRGKVKGIGKTEITGVGTLQVSWEDDMGRSHTHLIKNSLLVPALKEIVVSPQHWAQSAQDNQPNPRGTWCATYEDCIEVFWDQRQFKRTIFLQKEGSNVPVIYSTPGNFKFNSFCAQCNF